MKHEARGFQALVARPQGQWDGAEWLTFSAHTWLVEQNDYSARWYYKNRKCISNVDTMSKMIAARTLLNNFAEYKGETRLKKCVIKELWTFVSK